MKTLTFKRPLMVALLCLTYLAANAQGVVVYKKDGTKIKVPYEQLDSISTYNYDDEPGIGDGGGETTFEYEKDGHKYVDLRLPSGTLWATCNVGANSPEEYGNYFAWGEVTPKSYYSWGKYKYGKDLRSLTKYNNDSQYGKVDNLDELTVQDDAAYYNWGENWRMPNVYQFNELIDDRYTTISYITQNGVKGWKIVSKANGASIFLPDTGCFNQGTVTEAIGIPYWTCTLDSEYPGSAYRSGFDGDFRYKGYSIRPVCRQE